MKRVLTVALLVFISTAAFAFAGPAGNLDRSFGDRGLVVIKRFRATDTSVAVGGHNRIVAVSGRNAFKITRTLPDGDVDKRFGREGTATVRFGSREATPESVAIDRKGGVVVAGKVCSNSSHCHIGVARLKPDGGLDDGFDGDGKAEIHFSKPYVWQTWAGLGAGGRIVVAASATDSRSSDDVYIDLATLRSNGSLVPEFGTDGKVVSSFAPAGDQCVQDYGDMRGMALDSHHRIVAVGTGCLPGTKFSVARFKPNGEFDPSFGGDGRVNGKLGGLGVETLAIDNRDRIDVVVSLRRQTFAIARLRPDGGLDRSFGNNGRARGRWGEGSDLGRSGVSSVAVDSRGRIIVAGTHSRGLAFARFKPKGHLDRRFGHRGKVVVKDPRRDFHLGWLGGVAIDSRDRIIGSGLERHGHRSARNHLALTRLLG
jgi:uncharacterized delta-60 repeat protein